MNDTPTMITITKVEEIALGYKTFHFKHKMKFEPGQFVMLWIPGVDEKPFTLSSHDKDSISITLRKVGEFTTKMHELGTGDKVGIRGPYGKGFTIKNKAIVVGGGCGLAPLMVLIDNLKDPLIIAGAKTKDELLFTDRLKKAKVATDDGTAGIKGFTTQILEEELQKNKYDIIYTCGPEIMMSKVLDIANKHNIRCEASLERFMKCGIGLCGQCCCDDQRVCIDGPVFNNDQIKQLKDFGKFVMDKAGKKVSFKEYCA